MLRQLTHDPVQQFREPELERPHVVHAGHADQPGELEGRVGELGRRLEIVEGRRGAAAGLGGDPVPQALVITGIVVAFSATALAVVPALLAFYSQGIEGQWQGRRVRLGRAAWVGAPEVDGTATYLALDGATHAFRFADRLRPGAG